MNKEERKQFTKLWLKKYRSTPEQKAKHAANMRAWRKKQKKIKKVYEYTKQGV